MREVWIVVDGSVDATGKLVDPSPTLAAMVAAFTEAIATHSHPNLAVKVVIAVDLSNKAQKIPSFHLKFTNKSQPLHLPLAILDKIAYL